MLPKDFCPRSRDVAKECICRTPGVRSETYSVKSPNTLGQKGYVISFVRSLMIESSRPSVLQFLGPGTVDSKTPSSKLDEIVGRVFFQPISVDRDTAESGVAPECW